MSKLPPETLAEQWDLAKRVPCSNIPFGLPPPGGLCWAYVGPRTACSGGPLHEGPPEHAVFGLCRSQVGNFKSVWVMIWNTIGIWASLLAADHPVLTTLRGESRK